MSILTLLKKIAPILWTNLLLPNAMLIVLLAWNFRKLCIYKGVFPREPKKKFRGNHQTYYHLKDVSFIRHDPILEDLRAKSAYRKKIIKAKAKRNKELADILKNRQPEIKLDRLVRERLAILLGVVFHVKITTLRSLPLQALTSLFYFICFIFVIVIVDIHTLLMHSEIWMILSHWCTFLLHYLPVTGWKLKWSVSIIVES